MSMLLVCLVRCLTAIALTLLSLQFVFTLESFGSAVQGNLFIVVQYRRRILFVLLILFRGRGIAVDSLNAATYIQEGSDLFRLSWLKFIAGLEMRLAELEYEIEW